MAMKDLVIHLDNTPASDMRLQVGLQLAARFKARLTGVFAVVDRKMDAKAKQPGKEMAELVQKAEVSFKQRTAEADIEHRWVSRVTGNGNLMVKAVLAWASSSDMAVLGQFDPNSSETSPRDLAEQVINNCGRPVLVVPFVMSQPSIGNKIMIAFNGGREASRAMNDAIPLLKLSKDVRLAIVNWSPREEGNTPSRRMMSSIIWACTGSESKSNGSMSMASALWMSCLLAWPKKAWIC
ncbi:MAG: universal stress protein [Rhodospirillales bacterium]|jgi:nucleotide-binding universal stress UspA family protein|nr:universal stress protein [Rhodospirillales bacterium]MBT4085469.1 universal stress protein [Alphaproteobacteria bacterium]MBT6240447.1 universal stress protein [Rhodospirillaceae bacterium]